MYEDDDVGGVTDDSPVHYINKSGCNLIGIMHSSMSYFHLNYRGLSSNWESFRNLLSEFQKCLNSLLILFGVSEVYHYENDQRLVLPGYHSLITRWRENGSKGGVGFFVKDYQKFKNTWWVKRFYSRCIWILIYWNCFIIQIIHCWSNLQTKYCT